MHGYFFSMIRILVTESILLTSVAFVPAYPVTALFLKNAGAGAFRLAKAALLEQAAGVAMDEVHERTTGVFPSLHTDGIGVCS